MECIQILNCVQSLLNLETGFVTSLIESTLPKIYFEDQEDYESVLTDTITKTAHHAVLYRFYRYQTSGHPPIVVVGVQYLSASGISFLEYDLVPMKLDNTVCPIQTKFHGKKTTKYVFSSHGLYECVNNVNI